MNIREALRQQAPSLALQRAAGDEIARLDDSALRQERLANVLDAQLGRRMAELVRTAGLIREVVDSGYDVSTELFDRLVAYMKEVRA